MKIILARHAETGEQYQGRYIGSTDLPISPNGVLQAKDLAQRLKKYGIERCLVSPMLRTQQTAELAWGRADTSWGDNHLLKEIDFGQWEGKSFAEISREFPIEVEKWASEGDFQFPGGERTIDFWARIARCGASLSDLSLDSPLLVISHGGVIRALICYFLGLAHEKYLLFDVQPGRFAVMEIFSDGGVLTGLNL